MKKNLLLSLLGLALCTSTFAQTPANQRRDRIIRRLMDTADVPGLCVGMIENGSIKYVKAFGYKNAALHQLNDTATCFYAASLAKSLFAYLVMQLVQEKFIDLDKPLYTYLPKPLPEYETYKDLAGDERWKLITARHCLDHTTGFPNWRQFNPHNNNKLEIFFQPGEHYAYSGEGINLLQFVVETVTGKGLEELAQQRIFKPFGMRRTSFVWQPAFGSNCAMGHDKNGDTLSMMLYTTSYAAGSMETTVADYTRFIQAVLLSRRLDPVWQRQMLTPQVEVSGWKEVSIYDSSIGVQSKEMRVAYGLGWGLFASNHGTAFFKEGHLDGWEHYVIAWPAEKAALIILCNSSNGESMFKELVEKLSGVTIPWKWEGYWPYGPNVKLPVSALEPITGEYDGRLKAIVTLEGDRLKVASPSVNLSKTSLYAADDRHFYLKIMDTRIEFVKDADGKVIKAILDDEGEHYELKKVR